ncbi:MAG: ABC transporter substrate-binding protein, partial [Pseudobdellovibrionaceae bacterium]
MENAKLLFKFFLVSAVCLQGLLASAAVQNKDAPKGGNINIAMGSEPTTIHPIKATDVPSFKILDRVCDSLLTRDSNTYDWLPRIASEWEISKDRKVFTFKLNKAAKFHDGKPITAEDVKFSFDAIFEAKYEAAHLQPYYEGIQKIEIIDSHSIKAYAKDNYFKNFDVIAGLTVIPKHVYSDVEKSNKMNKSIVCSGPYALDRYNTGQTIVLKKFDEWYGNEQEIWKGVYN